MKTRKRLNIRFLACVLGVIAVLGIAVHFVHGYQVKRNASALKQRAEKAREDKDTVKEIEYLARYLGFRPMDNDALGRYGEILDEEAKKTNSLKGRMQAFFMLANVLRRAPERRDIRRRQVDTAMAIGKISDALWHLQTLQETAPKDAELARLKGLCEEATGKYADAVKSYKLAKGLDIHHIDTYLHLAVLYHDRLDNPKDPEVAGKTVAETTLDAMVNANPKDFRAYLGRARYYLQYEGQSDNALKQAIADVLEARKLAPNEPDVALMAADLARAQGDLAEAKKLLSDALKSHPDVPRLYLALVALEVRDDKAKDALNLVRKGLMELPDNGDLLHALADLLVQSGELEEAEENIARLRELKYAPPLLDYLQARVQFHKEEWSAAEQILSGVHSQLARSPGLEVQALLLLGQCYERLGNPDQALVAYQQAGKLDPLSVAAHYRAGTALMALGRTDAALTEFRSILTGPKAPSALHAVLARALISLNQRLPAKKREFVEIDRELAWAAKETPVAPDLPVLQAQTLLLKDETQVEAARRLIEEARKDHPDEVGLWIALAQLTGGEKALPILDDAQARPKLADSIELRLARLSYLMAPLADAQTPEQEKKKVAEKVRPTLAAMEKEATKLGEADRLRLLNGLAAAHRRLGDTAETAEAERLWRQVAKDEPKNLGVRLVLFDLASLAKDNKARDDLLVEIHGIEGDNGTFWRYAEAARLIQQARPAEEGELSESARRQLRDAREHLIKAATRRPSWARIPALEAEIDDLEGDGSGAIDKYQQAIKLGEQRPEIIRRTVQLLFEQQRFDEANQIVRNLLKQEKTLLSAGLGKLAVENLLANQDPSSRDEQQTLEALELAQKSVNKDAYSDHLWLGRKQAVLGEKKEAEKSLRLACKLGPTAPETWVTLVAFLVETGKKTEAEQEIQEARKKLPAEQSSVALAACYEVIGDLQEAEKYFSTALEAAPKDIRMLRNVASFHIRHGQAGKAEPHLRAILEPDSKSSVADTAWARRTLAGTLASSADRRRFKEALSLVEKNLAENKNSTADERARGLLLATRLSKRKEAIRLFEDLDHRGSLAPEERFALVRLYLAEDNWQKAQYHMIALASSEAKNPAYQAYYARRLLQRDDVAAAEVQLAKLEKTLPDSPLTREIKARVLQAKGKDAEAVAVVRAYAQSKDADLASAALLLESLGQKGDPKKIYLPEAEALYRKYVAQSEKPERFLALAGFLGRKHAVAEALSCCQDALRHKIDPAVVAQVMTSVLRETPSEAEKHGPEVEKFLKDMLAKTPESKSTPLLICLADLYDLRTRFVEAEALYRHVLRKDGENLVALNNLAWLLAFKKPPEALALVNKAIDLTGPSPELLDTRGVIYLMLGQSDHALEDLKQAITQLPSPSRSFHLARALAAANKLLEATQAMEEARKRGFDPDRVHPLEKPIANQLIASLGMN